MNAKLRERILCYNREMAERKEKAVDLNIIVEALLRLPYGQLKHVLTHEVVAVLKKYGLEVKNE